MQPQFSKNKKQKGFTLIEILIVVAIIGLLATFVLVNHQRSLARSRYSKAIIDMNSVILASDMYYDRTGQYAADVNRNIFPEEFKSYLDSWPKPACADWTYDWENWDYNGGNIIRVSLRNTLAAGSGESVYYMCIYDSIPGRECERNQPYHAGVLIESVNQITCNE